MLKLLITLITFPFRLLYKLGMFVISFAGKAVSLVLGAFITLVGILISMTIVGLVIGLPIMMMGLSIVLSALFG